MINWKSSKLKTFALIKAMRAFKHERLESMKKSYWQKIFANHISEKEQASQVSENFSKLTSKNNPIRIWVKDMKTHFTEENIQIPKKST